jgi:hypothetical protein
MKKRLAVIGTTLVLAAACGSDGPTTPSGNTGPIVFTAQLSAANENPPITNADANARGTVTITFNVPRDSATGAVTGGGSATFQAQMQGFPSGQVIRNAHIHTGAAAVNGAILVDTTLTPASPITLDANGTGTLNLTNSQLTQDWATQIVANPSGYYFNIHSATNPGGAMRGQLVRQ